MRFSLIRSYVGLPNSKNSNDGEIFAFYLKGMGRMEPVRLFVNVPLT